MKPNCQTPRGMWAMISAGALAVGLAMDAFRVALAQGAAGRSSGSHALRVGLAFGFAQGVMPLLGWLVGIAFLSLINSVDHWIVLVLLSGLGVKMLREAAQSDRSEPRPALIGWT